ncbi:MAG TPA: hypothetical protein VHS80_11770 [Chthoniobacterales bacterium]|jgi:nicotinamidase-related amidase|nr:hypothetical protein [Chthoniobacterales bacterium]
MSYSVLLVIDVQDSFKADPIRWGRRNNPKFESNVSALISAYREAGAPVISLCTRILTDKLLFCAGSAETQSAQGLVFKTETELPVLGG